MNDEKINNRWVVKVEKLKMILMLMWAKDYISYYELRKLYNITGSDLVNWFEAKGFKIKKKVINRGFNESFAIKLDLSDKDLNERLLNNFGYLGEYYKKNKIKYELLFKNKMIKRKKHFNDLDKITEEYNKKLEKFENRKEEVLLRLQKEEDTIITSRDLKINKQKFLIERDNKVLKTYENYKNNLDEKIKVVRHIKNGFETLKKKIIL
jgi:hypothetical protein